MRWLRQLALKPSPWRLFMKMHTCPGFTQPVLRPHGTLRGEMLQ